MLIAPLEYALPLAELNGKTLTSIQTAYAAVTDQTSFGILLFWARQKPRMDRMREIVLDSINVQKERAAAVMLQKELVMEEARVIGWVLTRLDAVPPAEDPAAVGRAKTLRDKLQIDYQSLAKTLADVAKDGAPTEAAEAMALQTTLFGTQLSQRRRGDRDRPSAPVAPPGSESPLSSSSGKPASRAGKASPKPAAAPAKPADTKKRPQGMGAAVQVDPNADIGGELSFDDGAS